MSPDDYQQQALRTEKTPEFVKPRPFEDDAHSSTALASATRLSRIMHAMIGICTEAGELQDAVKKHLIYGKELDTTNIIEEISDVLWYCALGLDAVGFKMSDAMVRNIAKLRARYPDKFTSEQALTRDLDAERKVLEEIRSPTPNPKITDFDDDRDADHALVALRRVAHALGVDSPIKLRDASNKRIAELCCKRIDDERRTSTERLAQLADALASCAETHQC